MHHSYLLANLPPPLVWRTDDRGGGINMLCTGYKEIFAPVIFWSLLPLLSMVESRTGWIQMSQMISLLTQWCLGKFKQGKTICKFTREKKIHWAKITLYRVCVSDFPKVSWKRMLCMLKTLKLSCLALLQCLSSVSAVFVISTLVCCRRSTYIPEYSALTTLYKFRPKTTWWV